MWSLLEGTRAAALEFKRDFEEVIADHVDDKEEEKDKGNHPSLTSTSTTKEGASGGGVGKVTTGTYKTATASVASATGAFSGLLGSLKKELFFEDEQEEDANDGEGANEKRIRSKDDNDDGKDKDGGEEDDNEEEELKNRKTAAGTATNETVVGDAVVTVRGVLGAAASEIRRWGLEELEPNDPTVTHPTGTSTSTSTTATHASTRAGSDTREDVNVNVPSLSLSTSLGAAWTGVVKGLSDARQQISVGLQHLAGEDDVEALEDAGMVYVTSRLLMVHNHGHVHMGGGSGKVGTISDYRRRMALSSFLERTHPGRYLVWDLSSMFSSSFTEADADALSPDAFGGDVLSSSSLKPARLASLAEVLVGLEVHLAAHERNVAVLYGSTGWTATVAAGFLRDRGDDDGTSATTTDASGGSILFPTSVAAVAHCRRQPWRRLTTPSQRRYLSYVQRMVVEGARPSPAPLRLRRLVFNRLVSLTTDAATTTMTMELWTVNGNGKLPQKLLKSSSVSEDGRTFPMEALVGGDVLLKCLMAQDSSSSASSYCIFRATFHTGFLGRRTSRVLRFTVDQLDGASSERFGTDFCMDLEYYPDNDDDIVDDDLVHVKPVAEDNHGHGHDRDRDHLNEQKTDELLRQVLLPQAVGPLDPILYDPNSRLWEVLSNPNDLRTSVVGLRRKPNPDNSANDSDTDFDPWFIDGMKVPHHRYNHNDDDDNNDHDEGEDEDYQKDLDWSRNAPYGANRDVVCRVLSEHAPDHDNDNGNMASSVTNPHGQSKEVHTDDDDVAETEEEIIFDEEDDLLDTDMEEMNMTKPIME